MGDEKTIGRAALAFVALGIALRVGRYALDFPIWWDEAFVGVNLLRRGYVDLLRPLDYGQVCPLLFLWAERASVDLFGFSEWSLRLVPLACGVVSVPLFDRLAARSLRPTGRLVSTAIFAASFHPIRHAADAKPYASDLLAALILLLLAIEWRASGRTRRLWALAAAAPGLVALSHPAIFAAIGVGLGVAATAWRGGRSADRWAALAALATPTIAFSGLFALFTSAQARATLPAMSADWAASFPPWRSPTALAGWLVSTHLGNMMAYPCGGPSGASAATFALLVVGSVGLARSGRGTVVAVALLPAAVAFVAAAMGRYPYGGSACGGSTRFMQYLAPSICLLAGAGGGMAIDALRDDRRRLRVAVASLSAIAVVGIAPVLLDLRHPYRAPHAEGSRRFARRFWPRVADGAEVACLSWDLGVGEWNSIHLGLPVALCNQAIESPSRRAGARFDPLRVNDGRPLRCVLSDAPAIDPPSVAAWRDAMGGDYRLVREWTELAEVGDPPRSSRTERYRVFEFVPRSNGPAAVARRPGPSARLR